MSEQEQLEFAEQACKTLVAATDGLEWDWDGRFGTPSAAFDIAEADTVQSALGACFERSWDAREIGDAPERVRAAANKLSGLRGGQLLWAGSPESALMLYCAWWPWGGNKRVSIRIGCDASGSAPAPDLKAWFGL